MGPQAFTSRVDIQGTTNRQFLPHSEYEIAQMEATEVQDTTMLHQRLADPETARTLNRLLDRAGDLEKLLASVASIEKSAPDLAAIATDAVDEACRRASEQGIHVEERLQGLMRLLLRLSYHAAE